MDASEDRNRILVIGAAGLDMVGRLRTEPDEGTSCPADIRVEWGGVARNLAENLARLGHPVDLLTAVGEDASGEALCLHLESAGVNVSRVLRLPQKPTGAYLAVIAPGGGLRLALDDMRVLESITAEWIELQGDLFADASLVVVDANLQPEALNTIFQLAKREDVLVAADPVSRSLASRLKAHLKELFVLSPNVREASALLGRELPSGSPDAAVMAARELVTAGVDVVVIALDEMGVAYADADGSGHIPALRTPIVDPTGATDALTAVILFGLANDIPLDESVKLGAAAAALTLRSAHTVVPDLTLEKLYEELM